MKITITDQNKFRIIVLEGEFSLYNVRELKETLFNSIESGKLKIVLSMNKVTYIDSSAIGVIYALEKKLNEMGKELLISEARIEIQDIMNISGINYKTISIKNYQP